MSDTVEYAALNFDGLERRANYRVITFREDMLYAFGKRDAAAILYNVIYRWQTEVRRSDILKEIERRKAAKLPPLTSEEVEERMWVWMSYNDFVRESGGAVGYNTVIRMLDYLINDVKAIEQRPNHDPNYPDYEYRINKDVAKALLKSLPTEPAFSPKIPKKRDKSTQMGTATEDSTQKGIYAQGSTHLGRCSTHLGREVYPFGGTSQNPTGTTESSQASFSAEEDEGESMREETIVSPPVETHIPLFQENENGSHIAIADISTTDASMPPSNSSVTTQNTVTQGDTHATSLSVGNANGDNWRADTLVGTAYASSQDRQPVAPAPRPTLQAQTQIGDTTGQLDFFTDGLPEDDEDSDDTPMLHRLTVVSPPEQTSSRGECVAAGSSPAPASESASRDTPPTREAPRSENGSHMSVPQDPNKPLTPPRPDKTTENSDTLPGKGTNTKRTSGKQQKPIPIRSEVIDETVFTEDGRVLFGEWCSIFKAAVSPTKANIKAANWLASPCAIWAEALGLSRTDVLKDMREWEYATDKNGYFKGKNGKPGRGVKLFDLERDFEGWQSAKEALLSEQTGDMPAEGKIIQWKGRMMSEEEATQNGYLGGWEKYKGQIADDGRHELEHMYEESVARGLM